MLHVLEQVGEPLEGVRVRTDPVEVDLAQLHVEVRVTVLVPANQELPSTCTCESGRVTQYLYL